MKTLTILNPTECDRLMNWCDRQPLEPEVFSGRQTCRTKKWWGTEAEFYFTQSHCYKRDPIESDPYLAALRDRFLPESDSILLYRYEIGGEIGEHLDKKCFEPTVIMINLIDCEADLFGDRGTTKFRWNRQNYHLKHGEVMQFDSRVLHSVPKLKSARYSLQFRKIA
ncbi:MAG TPA: hypothetical protein VK211_29245 [Kamptonema sp.]|nr:hypothetical protein [Kamptonema sp.]